MNSRAGTSYYRIKKQSRKIAFYSRGLLELLVPGDHYRTQLASLLRAPDGIDPAVINDRVDYYNKLDEPFTLCEQAVSVGEFRRDRSWTYFFDMRQLVRYFPRDSHFAYLFGDVTEIPECPTFVKSRPIAGDNRNSVLLKLDKLRHFSFVRDRLPFEDKIDQGLWRGKAHRPDRRRFIEQYADNRLLEVGDVSADAAGTRLHKPFMSINDQLKYKFIFSLEGNDVATNLKWIMASNSLCLMPKPRYESWFMEGRLIPDHHYVLVRDDFADAEDKIRYYLHRPDEARAIIENAHAHVDQFLAAPQERYVSLRVMQKYFERAGQV